MPAQNRLPTSFLGGFAVDVVNLQTTDDLDNLTTPYKKYVWTDKPINAPIDYGNMFIIATGPGIILQISVRFGRNDPRIVYRMREYGTWGPWFEINKTALT